MPKRILEKTALEVSRLREEGAHAVGGVIGLYLQIIGGSRVWVYRYTHQGSRRRMGLGSYPAVGLAAAREAARAALNLRNGGIDPLQARAEVRESARLAVARQMPFAQAADLFITEHEASWKNIKHGQQWRNTLEKYAFPICGQLNVADIDQSHVLKVLAPIWHTKTETASRVRGRIEQIMDWSTAHGHRSGSNPARWRGQLEHILADPKKIAPVQHHPAVPFADLPAVYQRICGVKGESARALQMLILTATRSSELRGMRWGELDLSTGIWQLPAARMKMDRTHRVPLPRQAVALLRLRKPGAPDDLVFASNRGGMLSDMALTAVMRRHHPEAVPHGFRSTFRDWAGECTQHHRDAIELCLAHSIDTKTEAAYRRGDMLEKRTVIMQEWADYAAPEQMIFTDRRRDGF